MEAKIGNVVYSKAGHDEGVAYVIVGVGLAKGYVAVADGDKHKLATPKIKNPKHLLFKGDYIAEVSDKVQKGSLLDCDLIYYLKKFKVEG